MRDWLNTSLRTGDKPFSETALSLWWLQTLSGKDWKITLRTDTYTFSSTSSAMRKTSKRSIIFPECCRISASASTTNSLCQSAEGLPGAEPVGWGGAWTWKKQKIDSYIRLQTPSAWFLLYDCVLVCKWQLRWRYNFQTIPDYSSIVSIIKDQHPFWFLIFRHAAIYEHQHICTNISNPNKGVYLDLRSSFFFFGGGGVAITGQVFGNTVITVRLSLINQRSAMLYVIFSLATKWHENRTLCQTYSVENRKKRESRWGNNEWSLSLKAIIIESKFSYGKTAKDLKA